MWRACAASMAERTGCTCFRRAAEPQLHSLVTLVLRKSILSGCKHEVPFKLMVKTYGLGELDRIQTPPLTLMLGQGCAPSGGSEELGSTQHRKPKKLGSC